jgi:hypothetical protein
VIGLILLVKERHFRNAFIVCGVDRKRHLSEERFAILWGDELYGWWFVLRGFCSGWPRVAAGDAGARA